MDINTFIKTDKGRYIVIGALTLICGIIFYLLFFHKKGAENGDNKGIGADTNVSVRDTTFKARGDVYSTYDKRKKVDAEKDFYSTGTQEMISAYNAVPEESNDELQRRADSILLANQSKVNYGTAPVKKTSSYGYSQSFKKENTQRAKEEALARFQKTSQNSFEDFFDGANAKKSKPQVEKTGSQNVSDAMIYAVISGDQIIRNKDRVTMKLTRDALINGELYRKNTYLYGIANFTQNRVNLTISNINQKPVSLTAQDAMDGNTGIYIEGESLLAETANEAAEGGVRDVNVSGIPVGRTLKRLVSKKQRENKVQLLNNYKIILKTE